MRSTVERVPGPAADVPIPAGRVTHAIARSERPLGLAQGRADGKSPFRNGIAISNSLNGYIEDPVRFVAPYIFDAGVRAIRVPLKEKFTLVGGTVPETIALNGHPVKLREPLEKLGALAFNNDVQVWYDKHEYQSYGEVRDFWIMFGKWLMATYPKVDRNLIVLELSNESSKGGWDPNYGPAVKQLVHDIRAAGIPYKLAVGWGNWDSVASSNRAFSELDAVGGANAIDPLKNIVWTGHYYQTTTGNDQPSSGKSKPEIKGSALSPVYREFFEGCRIRRIVCAVTEGSFGGGAHGWLANSGDPRFTGKEWLEQYSALEAQYPGTVLGSLVWGGGSAWPDTYALKYEYAKDRWDQTQGTEYHMAMKKFFALKPASSGK